VLNETFCITMLENIMCENDIVAPLTYGMTSVIEPFVGDVTMKYRFDSTEDEFWMAVDEAVNKINESFCDYEKGEELRKELKNYVLQNYTWDRIADKWLKII
jgi:glycosyltransferase involved in cell wall biosynthesis